MLRSASAFIIPVLLLLFALPTGSSAQGIRGQVLNTKGEAIPFANIFVQQNQSGASANEAGMFYLALVPGEYNLVISSMGYENLTQIIQLGDQELVVEFRLLPSDLELEEVIVRASKRDPAYAIIQKTIDAKEKYLKQVEQSRCKVYLKATELIEEKERPKRKKDKEKQNNEPFIELSGGGAPPIPEETSEEVDLAARLNLVEMQMILNYQAPQRYKEERLAYKTYGQQAGLFVPRFAEIDFNFYRNLVPLKGIADVPLISPISRTAILSYKYKLISSTAEGNQLVYKIKVTPRKVGNATAKGFIYINDGLWNINRIELKLAKGGLRFYDAFALEQRYVQYQDSLWIVDRQEFNYETKQGRYKKFQGQTLLRYSEYEANYPFPPKFFGNEVIRYTSDAYDRDTTYWQALRPEPLSLEENQMVRYRDSIEAVRNSPAYLDSVEAAYNKVTFLEVIWDGIGFRNYAKKQNIYIGSIASFLDFEVIGGFRLGPFLSYNRKYENGQRWSAFGNLSVGLRNLDPQGNLSTTWRYQPHRLADLSLWGGRGFESINDFDAYLNQLRSSNYILNDHFGLRHRFELFNGFYLTVQGEFNDRQSVEGYNTRNFLNGIITDEPPLAFEDYQALVSYWSISYTPKQRYMTKPKEKVILGSAFPTFTLSHKRGWDGLLGSDIDFDYLQLEIAQDASLGVWGNSKYTIQAGKFFNTRDLRFVDVRRFRQSDPILYSNPLYSFQALDTALIATDWFFEAHLIHHFNGLLVNNIPLVKKLRLWAVGGAGMLWIKESNFRQEEIFFGLERVFKLGPRRRLRVGGYGVLSESNVFGTQTNFKISLDLIDTWKKDWSF